jgi:expansin (peptidoglycan-binding protein)
MKNLCLVALVATIFLFAQAYASCSSNVDTSVSGNGIYPNLFTAQDLGNATYYGLYTGGGACTLDPTPYAGNTTENSAIWATVAIADNIWALFDDSAACGICLSLTGSGVGSGSSPVDGTYTVFANNQCPSCGNSGIDLGLNGDGVWDITWKAVPCPLGSTLFQYVFQGANDYYIKLQARNTLYPVAAMYIYQSNAWQALARSADNFFEAGSTVTYPLDFPISIKITSVTGDYVTDTISTLVNGEVIQGSVQFPNCAGSTTATTAATSSTTAAVTTTASTTAAATTTTKATTASATTTASTTAATTTTKTTTTSAATTASTTAAATTTSSSTTGSSSSSLAVYTDELQNGFENYSWGTCSFTATAEVYSEPYSISLVMDDYDAIYFHTPTDFVLDTYVSFQFYLYSPIAISAGSGSEIALLLYGSSGSVIATIYPTSAITANTWTLVSFTLSNFNENTAEVSGIAIQANIGGSDGTMYVDNVSFLN